MDEEEFVEIGKDNSDIVENLSRGIQDRNRHGLTHRKLTVSDDFADDFICSVCLRVTFQPTTLICGHTSCRICLARWFFSSRKKECPLCRQPYQGHPKINAHIGNTISKLFPKEVKERELEISQNKEDIKTLRKYDKELAKGAAASNGNNGNAFCLGVGLTICVCIISYLAWYWQFSERKLLVMKNVHMWKPEDVATWLKDLSWASVYANRSINNNIDGNMLLAMDNTSIEHLLNISDPLHQRALIFAIDMLKEHKVKMPSTLWEYKALYPGRCLFLVHGLKEFPRATFLYLWLYFYDDMFLPFVKASTASGDELDVSTSFTLADRISTLQWVYFLFSAAVLPQWHVIVLAYQMFSYHLITPLFVIFMAILNQSLEILDVIYIFRNNLGGWNLFQILKNYFKQLLHAFMFMVIWPVIPSFICDVIFYSGLYLGPFYMFRAVRRKLMEHFNQH